MILKKFGNIWAHRRHLYFSVDNMSTVEELGQGPQNVIT
jgi:hypothetical protein